jgi:hypothetical protein
MRSISGVGLAMWRYIKLFFIFHPLNVVKRPFKIEIGGYLPIALPDYCMFSPGNNQ